MLKIIILFAIFVPYECSYIRVYSGFWEPLINPRVLNYQVDAKFYPNNAKSAREQFEKEYGHRGERLISDLGNGRGLSGHNTDSQIYGDVNFYYTYPGANNN